MWFFYQIISTTLWASVNVIDSVLVHRFHKNPFVLMWNQSIFTLIALILFSLFFETETSWKTWLLFAGFIAFISDLVFFRALHDLDTSVVNIAWALLSIFLSITSFVFLDEKWSLAQFIGAVLILSGVSLISLWHHKIGSTKALLWLPLLAGLYTPFYFLQELALLKGEPLLGVFFWPLFGRECCAFVIPLTIKSLRKEINNFVTRATRHFYGTSVIVVILFFSATLFGTLAFETGPISLVSMVGNAQPFIVILLAWLLWKFIPSFSSKELLDSQSINIKLISFIIVFFGLGLLLL